MQNHLVCFRLLHFINCFSKRFHTCCSSWICKTTRAHLHSLFLAESAFWFEAENAAQNCWRGGVCQISCLDTDCFTLAHNKIQPVLTLYRFTAHILAKQVISSPVRMHNANSGFTRNLKIWCSLQIKIHAFELCWKFSCCPLCSPKGWTTACSSTSRPLRRRK